eukprot:5707301-Prymnesium_polylepis.1
MLQERVGRRHAAARRAVGSGRAAKGEARTRDDAFELWHGFGLRLRDGLDVLHVAQHRARRLVRPDERLRLRPRQQVGQRTAALELLLTRRLFGERKLGVALADGLECGLELAQALLDLRHARVDRDPRHLLLVRLLFPMVECEALVGRRCRCAGGHRRRAG